MKEEDGKPSSSFLFVLLKIDKSDSVVPLYDKSRMVKTFNYLMFFLYFWENLIY